MLSCNYYSVWFPNILPPCVERMLLILLKKKVAVRFRWRFISTLIQVRILCGVQLDFPSFGINPTLHNLEDAFFSEIVINELRYFYGVKLSIFYQRFYCFSNNKVIKLWMYNDPSVNVADRPCVQTLFTFISL